MRKKTLTERFANIGALPSDSQEERLKKKTLVLISTLTGSCAIFIWGPIYFIIGLTLSASIPFLYGVISIGSIFYFGRTKRYRFFMNSQLVLILMLPFLLQLTLGGFHGGSMVILWAFLSPLGALFFLSGKKAVPWFFAFIFLAVVAGLLDSKLAQQAPYISPAIITLFYILNISFVLAIVFILLKYSLGEVYRAKNEAERANKAKSQFLSSMSHELRTPLNSILGFSQLLEASTTEPLTKMQDESVGRILKSGNHLLSLIDEVLDLAKIESGNITISPEVVAVCPLIEDVVFTVKSMAIDKKVQINMKTAEHQGVHVMADRIRLRQILLNLLSNGIKYNKDSGTLTVTVEKPEADRIRIVVADTGLGISKENMKDLFKPFNRLDAENSNIQGTGIGLTITKRLVKLIGGEIGVESELGVGTKFYVELPYAEQQVRISEDTHVEHEMAPVSKDQKVLLYIEDNPTNQKLVEKIIDLRPNISLLIAPQAGLGIELAISKKPDLILMDINLPDMDGYEALNILKSDDGTSHIPVMAVSSNAMPDDINRMRSEEFVDYITKPIDIKLFLKAVDEVLTV